MIILGGTPEAVGLEAVRGSPGKGEVLGGQTLGEKSQRTGSRGCQAQHVGTWPQGLDSWQAQSTAEVRTHFWAQVRLGEIGGGVDW